MTPDKKPISREAMILNLYDEWARSPVGVAMLKKPLRLIEAFGAGYERGRIAGLKEAAEATDVAAQREMTAAEKIRLDPEGSDRASAKHLACSACLLRHTVTLNVLANQR